MSPSFQFAHYPRPTLGRVGRIGTSLARRTDDRVGVEDRLVSDLPSTGTVGPILVMRADGAVIR